ncbi:MAG: hypothetical protein R6U26_02265, partial [Candidatus Undinarchaeales archaeon]
MDKPRNHFELTFFPKETGVIERFEKKLKNTEAMEREVKEILSTHNIKPDKIFINKSKKGKKSRKYKDIFEGFKYKRYRGKIRGKKKGIIRDKRWKSDFNIYLLYGENRDGVLYSIEKGNKKELRKIGESIYNRLIESVAKQGAVPWKFITRVT